MKIAIIGVGGVGGYFGGRLARAGHEVTFVARGEHGRVMAEKGLIVKSVSGDFTVARPQVSDRIRDLQGVDLVLLGVKAWQVQAVAAQLQAAIGAQTTVMPLQNGVMAVRELAAALPEGNIVGGLCRIVSRIESPGVIRHFGLEPFVAFGELDNRRSERIVTIKRLFDDAGITARIADDIEAESWLKFMAICVSGLVALTRSTYGVVRECGETRRLMRDLLQEIYDVARRAGKKLDGASVEQTLALIDSYPHEATSSLTRDVWEGRPSEIEYQNGTVVRLAETYGIDVPVNRFIYSCILPMEAAARARAEKTKEASS